MKRWMHYRRIHDFFPSLDDKDRLIKVLLLTMLKSFELHVLQALITDMFMNISKNVNYSNLKYCISKVNFAFNIFNLYSQDNEYFVKENY